MLKEILSSIAVAFVIIGLIASFASCKRSEPEPSPYVARHTNTMTATQEHRMLAEIKDKELVRAKSRCVRPRDITQGKLK